METITGTPLPVDVLARRSLLPLKVAPVTLTVSMCASGHSTLPGMSRLSMLSLTVKLLFLMAAPSRSYDADALVWRYCPVAFI